MVTGEYAKERREAIDMVLMRGNYKATLSVVFLFVFVCLLIIYVFDIFLTDHQVFVYTQPSSKKERFH